MMQNPKQNQQPPLPGQQPKKPNESAGLNVDEFVKIFDPNTKETILEKRA